MFINDASAVITSASDLAAFASCEFAFLRRLDAKLGRVDLIADDPDALGKKTIELGVAHELAVLAGYKAAGLDVVELTQGDVASAVDAADKTAAALRAGAEVVYQATLIGDDFLGYADFLVKQPDGRYQVQDTKLARSAKVTALLQLATYAGRLRAMGIPVDDVVVLILGDGRRSAHRLDDIEPVFRNRWSAMRAAVSRRVDDTLPVAWGAAGHTACGRCAWCDPELEAHDDLFQIAGIRGTQRSALIGAGITTVAALAASTIDKVPRMTRGGVAGLRAQAQQQLLPHGSDGAPTFRVHQPDALAALPVPSAGDIFFDFEGDPLYSEAATDGDETRWGLDYLFGFVDAAGTFTGYVAHDLAQEKQALIDFLADVAGRRRRDPGLHIFHYAPYERSHLLALAVRHHYGEEQVDELLRDGVLVDLYSVVRRASGSATARTPSRWWRRSSALRSAPPRSPMPPTRSASTGSTGSSPSAATPRRPRRFSSRSSTTTRTTACRRCSYVSGSAVSPRRRESISVLRPKTRSSSPPRSRRSASLSEGSPATPSTRRAPTTSAHMALRPLQSTTSAASASSTGRSITPGWGSCSTTGARRETRSSSMRRRC